MKLELRMASRQTLTRQMAQERAAEKNLERGAQAQEEVGDGLRTSLSRVWPLPWNAVEPKVPKVHLFQTDIRQQCEG